MVFPLDSWSLWWIRQKSFGICPLASKRPAKKAATKKSKFLTCPQCNFLKNRACKHFGHQRHCGNYRQYICHSAMPKQFIAWFDYICQKRNADVKKLQKFFVWQSPSAAEQAFNLTALDKPCQAHGPLSQPRPGSRMVCGLQHRWQFTHHFLVDHGTWQTMWKMLGCPTRCNDPVVDCSMWLQFSLCFWGSLKWMRRLASGTTYGLESDDGKTMKFKRTSSRIIHAEHHQPWGGKTPCATKHLFHLKQPRRCFTCSASTTQACDHLRLIAKVQATLDRVQTMQLSNHTVLFTENKH